MSQFGYTPGKYPSLCSIEIIALTADSSAS
jgi:hypothetical protein